jgi:hypothetical protein
MMRIVRKRAWMAALVCCAAAWSQRAEAGSVAVIADQANALTGIGDFTGFVEYSADGPLSTVGILRITLTNTSTYRNGGHITGFLFNVPTLEDGCRVSFLRDRENPFPFKECRKGGLKAYRHQARYDGGAAINGWFNPQVGTYRKGPKPWRGIGQGETGTFEFRIECDNAGTLAASDFIEDGPMEFDFMVRFRKYGDRSRDKVPALLTGEGEPPIVPVPAPLLMGSAGLAGAVVMARRFRGRRIA